MLSPRKVFNALSVFFIVFFYSSAFSDPYWQAKADWDFGYTTKYYEGTGATQELALASARYNCVMGQVLQQYKLYCSNQPIKVYYSQEGCNTELKLSGHNIEIPPGKEWRTCSGYLVAFQGDGNFVVYNPQLKPVWASNTNGQGANLLSMQNDGNLVIYKRINGNHTVLWASNTNGNPGAFLAIQDDGNVVIYAPDGGGMKAIWATGTKGK